jgi:hypothetical protein
MTLILYSMPSLIVDGYAVIWYHWCRWRKRLPVYSVRLQDSE